MSRERKAKSEGWKELISGYVEGSISREEAAQRAGVARSTIEDWARAYRNEGESWLTASRNKVYSPETKRRAVVTYLAGESSQDEICEKHGIRARAQLRSWLKSIMHMETSAP